jgi:hypothetical protein
VRVKENGKWKMEKMFNTHEQCGARELAAIVLAHHKGWRAFELRFHKRDLAEPEPTFS